MNPNLVTTYQAIRDEPDAVVAHLSTHVNTEEHYYDVRSKQFSVGTAAECASDFLFLNHTCFNGLHRVNRRGEFNTPFGKYRNPVICDVENIYNVSALLQGVEIVHADFADTVKGAGPNDVVYLDPPYVPVSQTASFTSYVAKGFTAADQVRVRDVAKSLKELGVTVIVSNADTPVTRGVYAEGFVVREISARRSINSDAGKRGPVPELIIV